MNSEEILVAMAIKYDGDWEKIRVALNKRMSLFPEEIEEENREENLEYYLEVAKKSNYKYTTKKACFFTNNREYKIAFRKWKK